MFKRFRSNLGEAKGEIESALRELIYEYSTSDRENRFVVGGAAEVIVAAGMRSAGIPVSNLGHAGDGADLRTYAQALARRYSIKAVFSKSSTSIRLVNFLGDGSGRSWTDPTLFLIPGVGIVFGHPGHEALAAAVTSKGDALVIPIGAVKRHAEERPELVVAMDLPWNPGTGTRVASVDVAQAILDKPHYPRLGSSLEPDSVVAQLLQVEGMLERGHLTRREFDAMKARILSGQA